MTEAELARRFPLLSGAAVQKCRVCSCTQDHACTDAELGNCWWIEADLCSHCGEPEIVLLQLRRLTATAPLEALSFPLVVAWSQRAAAALQHASLTAPEAFEI